jgi:hypothetical protein
MSRRRDFAAAAAATGALALAACSPILQPGRDPTVSSTTTTSGFVLQSKAGDEEAERNYRQAEDKRRIESEQPRGDARDATDPAFAATMKDELARIDDAVVELRARIDQAPEPVRAHVERTLKELADTRTRAEQRQKELAGDVALAVPAEGRAPTRAELIEEAKSLLHELEAKVTEARGELAY